MTQLLFPLGPQPLRSSGQTWPPLRSTSSYEQSYRHVAGPHRPADSDLTANGGPPAVAGLLTSTALLTSTGLPGSVGLPEVFTAQMVGGDLAFTALIKDGVLDLERPGVAVYANVASTPLVRAMTCGLPHGPGYVIGRATAAWVLTGFYPPTEIDVLYERGYSPPVLPGRPNFARSTFNEGDVQYCGPVRVSSPLRTVMDLAAWCTQEIAIQHIFGFKEPEQLIAAALIALEKSYKFRNKVTAIALLESLDIPLTKSRPR